MRGWSAGLCLFVYTAGPIGCATAPARNVVLFVGDGMGLTTVAAARILEGQRRGEPGEENRLAFETLPRVALVQTFGTDLQVSESAATMSAMTTGFRTRAGMLGLDDTAVPGDFRSVAHARRPTLLEEAEARGLATGVVTTTRVTHATPAACYAHVPHRNWESDAILPPEASAAGFPDIARQLVEFALGDGIDVVLGGGRAQFLPQATPDPEEPTSGERRDGRNLIEAWRARFPDGVHVQDRTGFEAVDPVSTHRLLGLFSASHMAFESDRALDRAGEPSLSEMTAKALAILSRNARGFLLVVEGGRIDHAHHAGNAHRALAETIELSNAVRAVLATTDPRETLVVVTADHDHVLTFAGYPARGNPILGLVVEPDEKGVRSAEPARDANGLPYTTLGYANGPGWRERRPDLGAADTAALDFLQEATVPLPYETHGGADVPLYAGGAGSELFGGVIDQPDVHERIVRALGWR